MANQIEAVNTIAITSIEAINTITDDNLENLNTLEFAGVVFTAASGGTITTDGDYKVHTFTSSGNLNISAIGSNADVTYLVISGGGGGGASSSASYYGTGGGGAGGHRTASDYTILATGNHGITIGGGGGSEAAGAESGYGDGCRPKRCIHQS